MFSPLTTMSFPAFSTLSLFVMFWFISLSELLLYKCPPLNIPPLYLDELSPYFSSSPVTTTFPPATSPMLSVDCSSLAPIKVSFPDLTTIFPPFAERCDEFWIICAIPSALPLFPILSEPMLLLFDVIELLDCEVVSLKIFTLFPAVTSMFPPFPNLSLFAITSEAMTFVSFLELSSTLFPKI